MVQLTMNGGGRGRFIAIYQKMLSSFNFTYQVVRKGIIIVLRAAATNYADLKKMQIAIVI